MIEITNKYSIFKDLKKLTNKKIWKTEKEETQAHLLFVYSDNDKLIRVNGATVIICNVKGLGFRDKILYRIVVSNASKIVFNERENEFFYPNYEEVINHADFKSMDFVDINVSIADILVKTSAIFNVKLLTELLKIEEPTKIFYKNDADYPVIFETDNCLSLLMPMRR